MDDLKRLREKIDALDEQLMDLLSQRVQVCRAIGATKKTQKIPVQDARREQKVFQMAREKAEQLGLNPVQVEAIYREIVNMCSAVQE